MKRPSLGWILGPVGLSACLTVRCTEVTVTRDADGNTAAVVSGPETPPVEIDKEGIHEPPTPTPGPYEPVYPITPPPPTPTPRPK